MGQEGIYVGIDVAKAKVDVAVRPTGERWEVPRDEAGIPQLVSEMKTLGPSLVLLEATGGLELPLVAALAAEALHRSDSALGAFLRRKKAHLGAPKAITATAHKLARLIYSMLRHGQDYVDAGAEYYEPISAPCVACGQAAGVPTWLPTGANVRCYGRAPQPTSGRRLKNRVSP